MIVYVTPSQIFCSDTCAEGAPEVRTSIRSVRLPGRQKDPVLDILIGRATCDTCGYNLEDLAAEQARPLLAREIR
jgi:hypothetical protein